MHRQKLARRALMSATVASATSFVSRTCASIKVEAGSSTEPSLQAFSGPDPGSSHSNSTRKGERDAVGLGGPKDYVVVSWAREQSAKAKAKMSSMRLEGAAWQLHE